MESGAGRPHGLAYIGLRSLDDSLCQYLCLADVEAKVRVEGNSSGIVCQQRIFGRRVGSQHFPDVLPEASKLRAVS